MYIKCTKGAAHCSAQHEKMIEILPDDNILENTVKMEYRHQMLRWPFLVICQLRVWVAQRKYFV